MTLEARIVEVGGLGPGKRREMFDLMARYYDNVTWTVFQGDLSTKQKVICLEEGGRLRGFSTQALFEHEFRGRAIRVVFSGDTIIERAYWRSLALPVAWGRMMLGLLDEEPERELYWLLTTKGYRTYRFLPVFFREYDPSRLREIPAERRELIGRLAGERFGARFDAGSGVLRAGEQAQRLQPRLAAVAPGRRANPDIAFFERANPGHARGDELVCLCRFERDNLTEFILRRLGA